MREILFRGKRVDNGEWVYGLYTKSPMASYISVGEHGSAFGVGYGNVCYAVNPGTIGQYTGLTDKNGNLVYENDILSYIGKRWNDDGDIEEYAAYCVVKYGNFNCICCSGVYGWYFDGGDIRCVEEYTVVGNITDNEDLIQKEKHFDIQEPQMTEAEQMMLAETYMRAMVDAINPRKNKGEG